MVRSKGTWGTVREVPRKGSGRFQASYVHGGSWGVSQGTRYVAPAVFETRGDAWSWLDRERRLIEKGEWTPPADRLREIGLAHARAEAARQLAEMVPTVAEYLHEYLERDSLEDTSRERYRQLARYYILAEPATSNRRGMVEGKPITEFGLGALRITELTRAHVRQWWRALPVKRRESSCRQAFDLLRAMMNVAVDAEWIATNPVRLKDASHAQVSRERDLGPLPIPVLFAVADAMPPRWRLGVLMGGVLGLRSGEVRALQRRDFNLATEVATVKVQRSVKQANGKISLGDLKTARKGVASRVLPIPAALVPAVRQHLRTYTQLGTTGLLFWRRRSGGAVPSSDWLKAFKAACREVAVAMEESAAAVTQQTGEPESDESQRVRHLLTANGGYVFHGTRITGLTWAYRLSGGNLRAVQDMGGHTSSKTALRYQRADIGYLAAIADNVSKAIEEAAAREDNDKASG